MQFGDAELADHELTIAQVRISLLKRSPAPFMSQEFLKNCSAWRKIRWKVNHLHTCVTYINLVTMETICSGALKTRLLHRFSHHYSLSRGCSDLNCIAPAVPRAGYSNSIWLTANFWFDCGLELVSGAPAGSSSTRRSTEDAWHGKPC